MFVCGVWATEVEIIAMAHMLCVNIYTFDDVNKWYVFSGNTIENISTGHEAIYLYHQHRIHYDVVLSVHGYVLTQSESSNIEHSGFTNAIPDLTYSKKRDNNKRADVRHKNPETDKSHKVLKRQRRKRANIQLKRKLAREKARERYREKRIKQMENREECVMTANTKKMLIERRIYHIKSVMMALSLK